MLEKLQNIKFLKAKSITGVQLTITPDGKFNIDGVIVHSNKSMMSVKKTFDNISGIDDLTEIIPKATPIRLSIDGKGVIHKKIALTNEESIMDQVLPGADSNAFCIQKINTSDKNVFVSIIRKESLEAILNQFKAAGYFIIGSTLGPFILNGYFKFLDADTSIFYTKNHTLSIEKNKIVELSKPPDRPSDISYQFDDELITGSLLVPFILAVTYFTQSFHPAFIEHPITVKEKEEFFLKTVFTFAGWGILIFLFSSLLVNFLVFDSFNKKFQSLSIQINQNRELISKVENLRKSLNLKQNFLENNVSQSSVYLAYYADRIALNCPGEITLSQLSISPPKESRINTTELQFEWSKLLISGVTRNSVVLNDWMKTLKSEFWVNDVIILDFNQENLNTPGEFQIQVDLY